MQEEPISLAQFCEANQSTHVIHLVEFFRTLGPAAAARLEDVCKCWQMTVEEVGDLDLVKKAHLVRYKPNVEGKAGWEYSGSLPYTVDEYAQAVPIINPPEYGKIQALVSSMKSGLSKDVVLVAALDTALDKRVIVDGVHRSTGLVLLSKTNPAALAELLASTYKVGVVEIRSKWTHVLYPCDFLEFCKQSSFA